MVTTESIVSNGVQEEIALNRVIKSLQEITIHNEYESDHHALELGEKNNVFFVKLDGAVIYAGKDGKHAVSMFYDQIAKIDRDEENDADPEFSTLREILISRNKHVRDSLSRLGHHALANSIDGLDFSSFQFADLYKNILLKTTSDQLSFNGYSTKNFDMCPRSVEAFGNLISSHNEEDDDPWFEDEFEEAQESLLAAMKATDTFLGIEKKVVDRKKVTNSEIEKMMGAIEDSHYFIGELGRIIGDDLSGKFDYSSDHLMTVIQYHSGDLISKQGLGEIGPGTSTETPLAPKAAAPDSGGQEMGEIGGGVSAEAVATSPGVAIMGGIVSGAATAAGTVPEIKQITEIVDGATNELGDEDKWHTHKEEEAFVPEREGTDTDKIVKAIIPGSDNSILLLKDVRTPFWDLPGGHVKVNESLEEALHREVAEETGMAIVLCKELMTRPLFVGDPVQEQREITFFWVSATGEVNLSDEHDVHVWAPFSKIRSLDLGSFEAILTDLGKRVGGDIPAVEFKEEGVAQVMDASESEMDNVHNYSPSNKVPMGETVTIQTRGPDPQVADAFLDKQMGGTAGGYSEAGGPNQREKNPINPTGDEDGKGADNAGRFALATAETPASQAFSSGAVIDLPDDEAAEKGVNKNASGGAGTAGDGSPSATLSHSDVSDTTYGGGMGGNQGRPQAGSKGGRVREDFDSSLQTKSAVSKQQDMTVIGTTEGISTLPSDGANPDRKKVANTSTRYEYDTVLSQDNLDRRGKALPPEQRALGSGEINVWLSNDNNPKRHLADEDGENIGPDGLRQTVIEDGKMPHSIHDSSVEQYTNLSNEGSSYFKNVSSYIAKSADSPNDFSSFKSLVPDPIMKMDLGKTLIVGGWGSVYVVDREGHRINLLGLDKALKKFLANPDFANVNIFHSGIQVGKLIPEFIDGKGKVWKTHVNRKGLFAVVAFRTDLEVARRAMSEVIKGNLRGFSLSGNSNPETKEIRCEHGTCWQEIMDLEIYELTLCQEPMNQDSWITDIIQKPDAEECPECYANAPQAQRYDSSLRPVN